ncbi:MAG: preprotein translocase subunit YajC [Gammaproteobacteria bacterium]|jgi:preprotein translocase subunit YajC|nr:preprotein translocase subunit YajC [Gammaproteobacteria bacterium]MBT5216103.1 preprotein translocase subunit YajC [Gammaproteobacteria bacterium]MBT5542719.1 preprotein translocase subunit YajC [Gammaproteobacteria bacterium]MBT6074167.1 preprotein translocase subunit YajC [Gammaproteobacteria bacterium]MBT7753662.1 preprotein translocase subunit YajC [Gammaproteobacteria bacterium]
MFIENAWAQTSSSQGDPFLSFLPLIVIFVVFYFLLIRPQSKKQKEHREMIDTLELGNEVVTAGGLLGKIVEIGDQYLQLEISDGVKVKVQRTTIGALMPKGTIKKG